MHIRRWIFLGIILLVLGYFFYEISGVIFRPKLEILEPKDNALISGSRLYIVGRAAPDTVVWISGRNAQSDKNGLFQDDIPIFPGYNEIGVSVKDRFGNETRKVLKVMVR